MRKTKQKKLIIDIIDNSYDHPNAEEIYEKCRKEIPNISLGTVYRNLNQLTEEHLIRKVRDKMFDRYDTVSRKHNHFFCPNCNKIEDVYDEVSISIDSKTYGKVLDYEVNFVGICNDCLKKEEE